MTKQPCARILVECKGNVLIEDRCIRKWLEEHGQEIHSTPNSLVTAGPKHIVCHNWPKHFRFCSFMTSLGVRDCRELIVI